MAPFFSRCCLVAAGMWLASAGGNTSSITGQNTSNAAVQPVAARQNTSNTTSVPMAARKNTSSTTSVPMAARQNTSNTTSVPMAAGQNTSNTTSVPVAAGQNTSYTTAQPVAVLRTTSAAEAAEAIMKSKAEIQARIELINSSLHVAMENRQRAIADLAQAKEERETRERVLDRARASLAKAKEEFVEITRDIIHGKGGLSMGLADDAVVNAEANVRDALRETRGAAEQTAVAVEHAMEAEAHAKVMELEFTTNASSEEHAARDMRTMSASLGAERLRALADQARLVSEENATEEGTMPQMNETIKSMERALREAHARWARVQLQGDAMAVKEKRLQKRVKVLANHTRVLKAHQDSEVLQSTKTAGAAQQKNMKALKTTKNQIRHTEEVMGKVRNQLEAVREIQKVAATKATVTKHQGEDTRDARHPVLSKGRLLRSRK